MSSTPPILGGAALSPLWSSSSGGASALLGQALDQLWAALEAGEVAGVSKAFSVLQRLGEDPAAAHLARNLPVQEALQMLSEALEAGDVEGARRLLPALRQSLAPLPERSAQPEAARRELMEESVTLRHESALTQMARSVKELTASAPEMAGMTGAARGAGREAMAGGPTGSTLSYDPAASAPPLGEANRLSAYGPLRIDEDPRLMSIAAQQAAGITVPFPVTEAAGERSGRLSLWVMLAPFLALVLWFLFF